MITQPGKRPLTSPVVPPLHSPPTHLSSRIPLHLCHCRRHLLATFHSNEVHLTDRSSSLTHSESDSHSLHRSTFGLRKRLLDLRETLNQADALVHLDEESKNGLCRGPAHLPFSRPNGFSYKFGLRMTTAAVLGLYY